MVCWKARSGLLERSKMVGKVLELNEYGSFNEAGSEWTRIANGREIIR